MLAALVTVAGVAAFIAVTTSHDYGIQNRKFGVIFAILMTLDLLIIGIHELGHAAVLVHYGRPVKSAGFQIYFGAPSFFIESSDGLMLNPERRMIQAAAGAGMEIIGTAGNYAVGKFADALRLQSASRDDAANASDSPSSHPASRDATATSSRSTAGSSTSASTSTASGHCHRPAW